MDMFSLTESPFLYQGAGGIWQR